MRLLLCPELLEMLWKEAGGIYDVISTLKEFITSMWRPDKHKKHLQNNSTLNCLSLTRLAVRIPSQVFTATCREALWNDEGTHVCCTAHLELKPHSAI